MAAARRSISYATGTLVKVRGLEQVFAGVCGVSDCKQMGM